MLMNMIIDFIFYFSLSKEYFMVHESPHQLCLSFLSPCLTPELLLLIWDQSTPLLLKLLSQQLADPKMQTAGET